MSVKRKSQSIKLTRGHTGLSCNAAESSHGDFPMSRHYHRSGKLDVTALLAYLHKIGQLKSADNLPVR